MKLSPERECLVIINDSTGHLAAEAFGSQNILKISIVTYTYARMSLIIHYDMNLINLYKLSSNFLSLANKQIHLTEDEVKFIITEKLSLVRNILLSAKQDTSSDLSNHILSVKTIAAECMKLIRQHLPPQGKRSWSEYRINAMTTAYYGLSSYADTRSLSGINEAIRVIDELLEA